MVPSYGTFYAAARISTCATVCVIGEAFASHNGWADFFETSREASNLNMMQKRWHFSYNGRLDE